VHSQAALTPIPGSPAAVLGYVNLRGQLFLVLSANELLLGSDEEDSADVHLVVFRSDAGELFALQTGVVGDIVNVSRHQVDLPGSQGVPSRTERESHDISAFVVGHAKLDDALLALIDARKLLDAAFSGSNRM
jgi:purine-binding chemotaxis protein CheW